MVRSHSLAFKYRASERRIYPYFATLVALLIEAINRVRTNCSQLRSLALLERQRQLHTRLLAR